MATGAGTKAGVKGTTEPPAGDPAPAGDPPPAPAPAPEPAPEPAPAPPVPAPAPAKKTVLADSTPASKVPTKYDLKLPENSPLANDTGILDRTAAEARERGLSNAEAQESLNRKNQAIVDHVEAVNKVVLGWEQAAKDDPEIGGEKFGESAEIAKRVIDKFGSAEFKRQLVETGLGSHPEMIRIFKKIGDVMKDDKLVTSPTPGGKQEKTAAQILYPDQK